MSSGACRALVAVLLTLVATIVMALPVAAKTDSLIENANVQYRVNPNKGSIDVTITQVLKTYQEPWQAQEWESLTVEERANPRVTSPFKLGSTTTDLPGLWKAVGIDTPRIPGGGESRTAQIQYTIRANTDANLNTRRKTPARIDGSYLYFCVVGQDADRGSVRVKIDNASKWTLTQTGTPLEPTNSGFQSGSSKTPGQIFTCIEGVRDNRLATDTLVGPDDRPVELQAWEQSPNWLPAAKSTTKPTLDDIREFLGYEIPGESTLIIRMAPLRDIGGYASAHNTPRVVQLDETTGGGEPEHELAHAWFGTENFTHIWLREGMAEWTATAMKDAVCDPVTSNPLELGLSDKEWLVVKPTAGDDYEERIVTQDAAACGIVSAMVERMPPEQWTEVIGSMLRGETKYIGSAGPEIGTSTIVDYKEWLDAVDERGLVPAASDPAYAANRDDLDFAQNVLDEFGIPDNTAELVLRSEARALYHQFLDDAAPMGAPHAVRKDMDDWVFERAMSRLQKSYEVYGDLTAANDLLPTVDLLAIVRPQFEAAPDEASLDAVRDTTQAMLEGAEQVFEPLGDLTASLPAGWVMPAAVTRALTELRFDDIMAAITPSIVAAQEISAADAALPQAGLLDKYKVRFENTSTANKLDDLASAAASERRNAERAGRALDLLQSEVGDWAIPAAVTNPLEQGQLQNGIAIIGDARAVVEAATEADLALPEAGVRADIQPRFEAVATAGEMAALRTEVETRRDEAVTVGNALSTLNTLVPDWQVPAVVADPVEAGDFAAAAATAAAAQRWIEAVYAAEQALPDLISRETTRADFEAAGSLEDLEAGAVLAERQKDAAIPVRAAQDTVEAPRGMLTDFGLWGVDVSEALMAAQEAAVAGDVSTAINEANKVVSVINGGSGSGSLRLGGLVFFGVAVLGVLGLWVMLRRQAGPSWARSSTPHWVDGSEKSGGLLGSGKKKDGKKKDGK